MSASDTCKRTILSTVSIVAKGQIKEESLLCNVESWESLSLADTSDLVLGRVLVADAAVLRLPGILLLPGITLPSIEQKTFALIQILASVANW